MEKLIYGLIPFIGAIFAVLLYRGAVAPSYLWLSLGAAAVGGFLAWTGAMRMPRFSAVVVNVYVLLPICLIAMGTIAVMYLTLQVPGSLGDPNDDEVKTLAGVIVGAASAWFASLWTDDIAKGADRFSPAGLMRESWRRKFAAHPSLNVPRTLAAENAYRALFDERFAGGAGWGPIALFRRAGIVSRWLY
jgi:hypothetical protein